MRNNNNWFEAACVDGDLMWIAPAEYDFFYALNIKTLKVENVFFYPEHNSSCYRQYGDVIKYCNKLYFSPVNADSVLIFDCITKKFDYIDIDKTKYSKGNEQNVLFYTSFLFKNKLFLLSRVVIIEIDLTDQQVYYIDEPIRQIEFQFHEKTCMRSFGVQKNNIIMSFTCGRYLASYDINSKECSVCKLWDKKCPIISPIYDGKHYWAITFYNNNNYIVQFNPFTNNIEEHQVCDSKGSENYLYSYCDDGKVSFFPSRTDYHIVNINIETNQISFGRTEYEGNLGFSFSIVKDIGSKILLFDVNENNIMLLNKDNNGVELIDFKQISNIAILEKAKILSDIRRGYVSESEGICLRTFIESLF